ncbi:expression site-associated gene (ESAG-like) protein [Trypanosoma cruzi marinkellei]|uniref:Expression site-associated gene (ESAG-like) protein n=1 Tax=Trypanosoma cruzi marinkellei TaxID=85056 RepID=K2NAE8_TRYCR|nr:expression site-associated gene (ESAG-like) protein [Trypanosoma cruzi marinkellei]
MRCHVIYFILMNPNFKRAFLLLQFFLVMALLIAVSNWETDSYLFVSETLVKDDAHLVGLESGSEKPRVVFLVSQTRKTPGWCRMLLTSLLSEVSVVSIGFGNRYSHVKRPFWILDYIDNERLRDEDVVVAFDGGDTFITGSFQVKQAVNRFLEATAPTAAVFNVTAVHRGEATAPLLFAAERPCFAPLMKFMISSGPKRRGKKCVWYYSKVWEAMNASADQRMVPFTSTEELFLNAGGMVGRVWAIREALKAYKKIFGLTDKWWCDQSIWALLYVWSLTQTTNVSLDFRIPYGILNLDYHHVFFKFLTARL